MSYRSKPHCGGQGVYVRHLSRELTALGHTVEVFSRQPYPELDEGVALTKVPSLDLYREPDPFRMVWPWEFRDLIDAQEFAIMCTAGFPEPRTFAKRLLKVLQERGSVAAGADIESAAELLGALDFSTFFNWIVEWRTGSGATRRFLDAAKKRRLRAQVRQLVAGLRP